MTAVKFNPAGTISSTGVTSQQQYLHMSQLHACRCRQQQRVWAVVVKSVLLRAVWCVTVLYMY